jgi:acetolactate synthase-1/2/3 large subunit/sulfoacetaldehyde acetyltransferase
MFRPVTKHALLINKAERIPELLRGALRTAMSGRPGPVFVEIPRDVLSEQAAAGERAGAGALPRHPSAAAAPRAAVREAVERLRRAERPLLLVGGGATRAGANELVVELSERYGIPMITAYGRNDAVPSAHPLYLGPLGRAGAPEAAAACWRADLIVAVGSRLAQFTSQFDDRYVRPDTAIIQIDIEGRDIGRYYPVAGASRPMRERPVQALLSALDRDGAPEERAAWRREAEALRAQRLARLAAEANLGTKPMKPQRAYAELRRVLPPETIVALDAGAAPAYGYDRLLFARPRTFLTPLDLGGLGFAFPVALGAKLGRPDAPVIAVHGDGGFLMNAQEIETAVRHGIGVVTIVMNNNCWGSEKAYQKHFYESRFIGCDIGNPRYDQLARLFGAGGYYVEHPDQIGDAVKTRSARARPRSSRSRSTRTSSRLRPPRSAARTRRVGAALDTQRYS